MPGVCQVTIQAPYASHEPLRVRGNRFGEVAAGRRDGADDGHRAGRTAQRRNCTGAGVERRKGRSKVGRVALLGGQRSAASAEFAKRFGPARRGIGYDNCVVAHVAVVLGDAHAGVDAGLLSHHRHVRSVRDDDGPIGQPPARTGVLQLSEVFHDLGHLVAALAATDIDDDIGVAPFGQLLQQNRLARAKSARDRRSAATRNREQQIENALAGRQRLG